MDEEVFEAAETAAMNDVELQKAETELAEELELAEDVADAIEAEELSDTADIEIRQFEVGPLGTNCYAIVVNGGCMVIDPGDQGAEIAEALSDVEVGAIVATHGHPDHVGGVAALKEKTGAPYFIHEADNELAKHAGEPDWTGLVTHNAPEADMFLHEGDVLQLGPVSIEVFETPGHTPGGVVLVGDGFAFVGDTLFPGSCGRSDLPGGDPHVLGESLQRLKEIIPPETEIFCGHGPSTTMKTELRRNPYLQ